MTGQPKSLKQDQHMFARLSPCSKSKAEYHDQHHMLSNKKTEKPTHVCSCLRICQFNKHGGRRQFNLFIVQIYVPFVAPPVCTKKQRPEERVHER